MGFETFSSSLQQSKSTHLNFVPMGFETTVYFGYEAVLNDLNFVPMGFETCFRVCFWHGNAHLFELCPYGI